MLSIHLEVREFLDGEAVDGAEIAVALHVVPRFREVLSSALRPGQGKPEPVLVPDFSRKRSRSIAGIADGDGQLTLRADLDDLFVDRLGVVRNNDQTPADVVAVLELAIRSASYDGRFRFLSEPHGADDTVRKRIAIDFAKCIVGHAEPDAVKLWFCLHGEITVDDQCLLAVRTKHDGNIVFIKDMTFEPTASTRSVTVSPLKPSQTYLFELRYITESQSFDSARVIARGRFATPPRETRGTRIAFGSCHLPTGRAGEAESVLDRWIELRNLSGIQYERLLLLGDQIYGDGLARMFPEKSWFQRYVARYHQLWSYAPMRDVLRTTPTCMMLDDHDVVDDFGVIPPDQFHTGGVARVDAALAAYRLFQHVHNPSGDHSPPFHYSFRHADAACFVADVRTQRRPERSATPHPILGAAQFAELQSWARSDTVRDANIVVFANPVPIPWIPVETLKGAAAALAKQGGQSLGALLGAAAGGPFGAFVAGAIGGELAEDKAIEEIEARRNDPDVEDQWTFAENQREMVAVLDLLFDLANGIDPVDGSGSGRRRAVFLMAGDAHLGGLHIVRSMRPRHAANPILFSATASPIARVPEDTALYVEFVRAVRDELGLGLGDLLGAIDIDLNRRELIRFDPTALAEKLKRRDSGTFVLDTEGDKVFLAETLDIIGQRNYGLLSLERLSRRRAYRMEYEVRGTTHRPAMRWDFDLDEPTFSLQPFGSLKGNPFPGIDQPIAGGGVVQG